MSPLTEEQRAKLALIRSHPGLVRTPPFHPGPSPFFCRMHGEPLVYSVMHLAWRCPEIAVCGTWVGKELVVHRLTPERLRRTQIVVGQIEKEAV